MHKTAAMSAPPDFQMLRDLMVASQLRPVGITDPRIVAAIAGVPRERFVPAGLRSIAYADRPLDLGGGRALNPPATTGRLLHEADPTGRDTALVIGAAGGYTAALVAALGARVVALEAEPALLAIARDALAEVEAVTLVGGPLPEGHPAGAPYSLIFVDGAIERIPASLTNQLAEGGRLVAAIRDGGVGRLILGRKNGGAFGFRTVADADAVTLPGFAPEPAFVF